MAEQFGKLLRVGLMLRLCVSLVCVVLGTWPTCSPTFGAEALTNGNAKSAQMQGRTISPSKSVDVTLGKNNTLRGKVVDRQGRSIADAQVDLLGSRGTTTTTRTNLRGQFVFSNLSTGVVIVKMGRQVQKVRVWSAAVAPPSSRNQALFVVGSAVRGQCADDPCGDCDYCGGGAPIGHFGGFFQNILQNPWIVGVGTAAAIAIPLATDDDDAS